MYVDLYALQTVPPSNMNRDDAGAPKTTVYGGTLRARVSSQAWKRAMRDDFRRILPEGSLGVRTKLIVEMVEDHIAHIDGSIPEEERHALALSAVKASGLQVETSTRKGADDGKDVTKALAFVADSEARNLAHMVLAWRTEGILPPSGDGKGKASKEDKKAEKRRGDDAKAAFHGDRAVDIALFGRMMADQPEYNVDAAAQVAHAISVDPVRVEYDYYTAIDELAGHDNKGASMVDATGYDSSTLYRYANVNVSMLLASLGSVDATAEALSAFVRAFAESMPTGKQNSFANRTLPGLVAVRVHEAQPLNAVTAFEEPVRATADGGIMARAARSLATTLVATEGAYDLEPVAAWLTATGAAAGEAGQLGAPASLSQVCDAVAEAMRSGTIR